MERKSCLVIKDLVRLVCTYCAQGGNIMEFFRIGEKLISKDKLLRVIDRILTMRASGLTQQEVADKIGVDRTFISRLEAIAEVRKGGLIGIIGFPLGNKSELEAVCEKFGVDYTMIMTDKERWDFIQSTSGLKLINAIMDIIAKLRDFDIVIMIGSDMRIRLAEALLGDTVIGVEIGQSPIEKDVYFNTQNLIDLMKNLKGGVKR